MTKPVSRAPVNVISQGGAATYISGDSRQVVGFQEDGTLSVTTVDAPAPPVPSTPITAPSVLSASVSWDGLLDGSVTQQIDVPQSGFEDGIDLWEAGGSSVELDDTEFYFGSQSAKVTPFEFDAEFASADLTSAPAPAYPGLTYRAQAWIKLGSDVDSVGVYLDWYADDTFISSSGDPVSGSDGSWFEVSVSDVAPVGATSVRVRPSVATPDPELETTLVPFWIDNITLDEVVLNMPLDFSHIEIHISTEDGFAPTEDTLQGTMNKAGTLAINSLEAAEYFVVLIVVNTSGAKSAHSTQVSVTPDEVVATDIADGSVTVEKLASDVSGSISDAVTTATDAATTASGAATTASAAQSTADSAASTASAAQTTATGAQGTATAAQGTANTAVSNAAAAQSTANTANSTAGTALTNAGTAQTTANTAVSNAASALAAANSKIKTFVQGTAPTASGTGDLWIDSSHGNKISRWSGSAWVAVPVGAEALAAQLILGSDIIAGDPASSNVTLNGEGLTVTNQDGKPTIVFAKDGSAVFNGDGVTANRVSTSTLEVSAGTQGGVLIYGSDPGTSGVLNADPTFADPDHLKWTPDSGTTHSTVYWDDDNPYNGYPASLKVNYEEISGSFIVGQVTSERISIQAGVQCVATLVATVQQDVNVSIVLDFYTAMTGGSHISGSPQSNYITEPGIWQTTTISAIAPSNAQAVTIKAFGRASPSAPIIQVNLGYFSLTGAQPPVTLTPAPGKDEYGNEYPAGLRAPAVATGDLTATGSASVAGTLAALDGIYTTTILAPVQGTILNPNPEFATNVTGWTTGNSTSATWAANADAAGDGYAVVKYSGSGNLAPSIASAVSIPVTHGISHTVSARLYPTAAAMGGCYAQLIWYTSGGAEISRTAGSPVTVSTSGWGTSTLTQVAPATAATCRIRVAWGSVPNSVPGNQSLYVNWIKLSQSSVQFLSMSNVATTEENTGASIPAGLSLPAGYQLRIGTNVMDTYPTVHPHRGEMPSSVTGFNSSSETDIAGVTLTFPTYRANATVSLQIIADMQVTTTGGPNQRFSGHFNVDGVQNSTPIVYGVASTVRGTVAQTVLITVPSAGSHTVKLTGSTNGGVLTINGGNGNTSITATVYEN